MTKNVFPRNLKTEELVDKLCVIRYTNLIPRELKISLLITLTLPWNRVRPRGGEVNMITTHSKQLNKTSETSINSELF